MKLNDLRSQRLKEETEFNHKHNNDTLEQQWVKKLYKAD